MEPRRALISLIVLAFLPIAHAQRATQETKPLIYNDPSKPADSLAREAKNVYATRFRVVDVKQSDSYSPSGMKGLYTSTYRLRDPRSMRLYQVPGNVSYTWIVTPEGRVIEPHILHSTDETVSKYILEKVSNERYVPARLRSTPVYSLHTEEWTFGGPDNSSRQSSDGLGVYHSRDR